MIRKLLPLLCFILSSTGNAQINADSLFNAAIEHSRNQDYSLAVKDAGLALDADPGRADIMRFIANVYAWRGDYRESISYLEKAYELSPENPELYDIWLNVLLWNSEFGEIPGIIELAEENNYKNRYNIVLKRVLAYKGLEYYHQGIQFLNQNRSFLDSTDIGYLYNELQTLARQNAVSVYYSADLFENNTPEPQHLAYIDYGLKIGDNTLIIRGNYTQRFGNNDFQFELDYYHVMTAGRYFYSNYGTGIMHNLFPLHRAGFEFYTPAGESFETSLGGRFLKFDNSQVYILTGHVGTYISNWWLALRPFYTIKDDGNTISAVANGRVYSANGIDYWGFELGYGSSPDDRFATSLPGDRRWLNSYRIKIQKNIKLFKANEMRLAAGWANEEITDNNYRNRLNLELIFTHRF